MSEPQKAALYIRFNQLEALPNIQMLLIEINEQMNKLSEVVLSSNVKKRCDYSQDIFTIRENEVIYWTSKGKNYSEIANILNMSLSTVKFHMKNVVKN